MILLRIVASSVLDKTLIREMGLFELRCSAGFSGLSKKMRYTWSMEHGKRPVFRMEVNSLPTGKCRLGSFLKSSATQPSDPGAFFVARVPRAFEISMEENGLKLFGRGPLSRDLGLCAGIREVLGCWGL